MLHEYGHIAVLVIIALVFPAGALVQSWVFQFVRVRPRVSSDPVKEAVSYTHLRAHET